MYFRHKYIAHTTVAYPCAQQRDLTCYSMRAHDTGMTSCIVILCLLLCARHHCGAVSAVAQRKPALPRRTSRRPRARPGDSGCLGWGGRFEVAFRYIFETSPLIFKQTQGSSKEHRCAPKKEGIVAEQQLGHEQGNTAGCL